jgi:hypothetical protein
MLKKLLHASLILIVTGFSTIVIPSASRADEYCQCAVYVRKALGYSLGYVYAKDAINALPKKGFRQISTPQDGAIVVMQPNFSGLKGTDGATAGHIGFAVVDSRTGKVSVRGANQGGKTYKDAGCNNVSVISFRESLLNNKNVSFWIK